MDESNNKTLVIKRRKEEEIVMRRKDTGEIIARMIFRKSTSIVFIAPLDVEIVRSELV